MTNRYSLKLTDCKLVGFGVDTRVDLEYTFTDKEGESKPVSLEEVTKLLNEQDERITTLTRAITDTIKNNNELIKLLEDFCEKHYDTMNLQSKTDFGKILKHLGWEGTE